MKTHAEILARLFMRVIQAELARELGLSRQAVNKWTKVPRKRLPEVARASGMTEAELRPDLQ